MISIRNVSFSYAEHGREGVQGINLEIADGECVLLCGRSGCGKTTVTRLINGLIPYFFPGEFSGEVWVNGKQICETPMYEIAKTVGSVFQNPKTQFFNVDTDSEIVFGIENASLPREELLRRLDKTTADLKLGTLRGRNIFGLSGGEKQKIAFASVYALNPDIYLLAEPSSNLDLQTIEELRRHLKLIKAQGRTIVAAEHRLYYLMDLADRIIYLEDGKIAGEYTPETLRRLPAARRQQMGLRALDLKEAEISEKRQVEGKALLELKNVTLEYGKKRILEGLTLKAAPGEVIGIAGRNGAGKTTFCRSLCGLHKEHTGGFYWDGTPETDRQRRSRSYLVMQDVNYELFAESVEAECSFGIRNPDRELAETAMKDLGLWPYRDRHPNTLSGGQKQRTAAAVSLVCKKELIIFDEPTSGLDYDSMRQLSGLIGYLAEKGTVIFIVTHDFEFLSGTCTRVLYFDGHRLEEDIPVRTENADRLRRLFLKDKNNTCEAAERVLE